MEYEIIDIHDERVIRWVTVVTFADGSRIRFTEKLSKKEAVKQAVAQKERELEKAEHESNRGHDWFAVARDVFDI